MKSNNTKYDNQKDFDFDYDSVDNDSTELSEEDALEIDLIVNKTRVTPIRYIE